MKAVALALLAATLLAAGVHAAEEEEDFYVVEGPSVAADTVEAVPGELDTLFAALRRAPNAERARAISNRIWQIWLRAPDARAASRMNRNIKYRGYGEYWDSMEQVEHVIRRHPLYPEAYNQRAFLHFLQGDYEASLADCRRVLELEPRHFGCMGGMARALLRLGRREEARAMMRRALALHPFIEDRRLFPDLVVPRLDL